MVRSVWRRIGVFVMAGLIMAGCSGAYLVFLNASFDRREEQALEAGTVSANQLAYAMAENTAATIRQVDFALRGLTQQYIHNNEAFLPAVNSAIASFPALMNMQVTVVGEDGTVLYSSHPNWKSVSTSDRKYFTTLKDGDDILFVGEPLIGRFSGVWYLQFARRMERDGRFAGVIVLSLDPHYLSRVMGGLELGPEDSAGLVLASDGAYLARNRDIDKLLGKKVKVNRPYLAQGSGESGIFIDEATYEHVDRIYAWRRLPNLPLVIFVGLAANDILQPIRQARFNSMVQSGIMLGILVPAGFALIILEMRVRGARRRLAESEKLYRNLFEHNIAIKMLIDPEDGQIVEVNPAACAFYGYDRDQMIHMNIMQINRLPGPEVLRNLEQVKNGVQGHFQFSHRLASGEIREVEIYAGPVHIEGRLLLYTIIHDITEQKTLAARLQESEIRYRMLFTAMPDGLIVTRADGSISEWNAAALTILHVDEEGLKERIPQFLPTDESRPCSIPYLPANKASSDLYAMETPDGKRRWIYINSRRLPPLGETGEIGAITILSDMTHVVALEESALISQSVFDVVQEALLVAGPDFDIILVNPAFQVLTGHGRNEALDCSLWALEPPLFPAQMERVITESLQVRNSWSGDIRLCRKNGTQFTGALHITAVYNPDGRLLRYVCLFLDVTEKKRQEKEMWQQANFDALTGLPNRTLLNDRVRQALAQAIRLNQMAGLLFIDLDRFKPVNDTYGHAAGDLLLKQVGQRIQDCVRVGDTVARVGGDEFVILLPMVESEQKVHAIAKRILDALNRPFRIEGADVDISASIGIALSREGDQVDGLVKRADDAMYQAKKSGSGMVYIVN